MPDSLASLGPWIGVLAVVVAVPLYLLQARRDAAEERRRSRAFVAATGRVAEVGARTRTMDTNADLSPFVEEHRVRCTFAGPSGPVDAWAQDTFSRRQFRVGDQIPVWFDPADPRLFVVRPPHAVRNTVRSNIIPVIVLVVAVALGVLVLPRVL